jgi:hypothetical protein
MSKRILTTIIIAMLLLACAGCSQRQMDRFFGKEREHYGPPTPGYYKGKMVISQPGQPDLVIRRYTPYP